MIATCRVCGQANRGRRLYCSASCQKVAARLRAIDRFHASTIRVGSCLEWTGSLNPVTKYGQTTPLLGTNAHRAAYALALGPIPKGMQVCHRCDNTRCVDPSHLFLGTPSANIQDSIRKGRHGAWKASGVCLNGALAKRRFPQTHCKHGHDLSTAYRNQNGHRVCRDCASASSRRYYGEHRALLVARQAARYAAGRARQVVLQGQPSEPELRRGGADVRHQILQPVPFRQLPVVDEVG